MALLRDIQRMLQKPGDLKHVQSKQDAELEDLFASVEEEIEDRYNHLEALGDQCDKDTQDRIKKEIVERIGELQRIRELQNKIR